MFINTKNYLEIAVISLLSFLVGIKFKAVGIVLAQIVAVVIWQFRDVRRHFSRNNKLYLSPVDGIVLDIDHNCVIEDYKNVEWQKISIGARFYDANMQYSPISGEVVSSEIKNEVDEIDVFEIAREKLYVKTDRSFKIPFNWKTKLKTVIGDSKNNNICIVEQIRSGLSSISGIEAKSVEQGAKIAVGHVRFGMSNAVNGFCAVTNVYIPKHNGSKISVLIGQTMVASETPLACSHSDQSIGHESWNKQLKSADLGIESGVTEEGEKNQVESS